ncbi:maleylacetate reductase [Streptomyces ruber]|uniref:Maleylacetate reductase n=2 Tax=Streptomyces TaxID=1883 RepID=A0A918EXD5_9ACTN|nr:maleylacetate reductase [Streptomyces ruber]GGQ86333.1 maleylacetate reductase [Streptomyces ruber]
MTMERTSDPAPREFVYEAQPARVVFRPGASVTATQGEAERLGLRRLLVLSGPGGEGVARTVADALDGACAGLLAEARGHVSAEVAHRAVEVARAAGADGCVAVGGGSAIGLGKAVALRTGLPLIAVPTTYSGSEMTPVWELSEHGVERTGRDPSVLPRSVVYDPDLTFTLPAGLTVTSGVSAVAHAAEALYAPDASPLVRLMAEEGARAMTRALPVLAEDPGDPEEADARGLALYGAWLCGAALGVTTMGLHHQLCHVLGDGFALPHAETHAVLLPYVLGFNAPAAPGAIGVLGRALDADDPVGALWTLAARLGAPRSLAELGLTREELPFAAARVTGRSYPNPRKVTVEGALGLLKTAYEGRAPAVHAQVTPRTR